jgi:2-amino-4-hydroxy-6-hydroxymethyldihydropteridine diphosphokinase
MSGRALWIPACIGIGSNLDDPVARVHEALERLGTLPDTRLLRVSSRYRNPPLGPADQPDYVNAVAALLTRLPARALLAALQEIERGMGRDRDAAGRWGPRRIDLDILTYGLRVIDEDGLTIPHPGISERNFVLFPLLEIAPELHVPGQAPVHAMADRVDGTTLVRLDDG